MYKKLTIALCIIGLISGCGGGDSSNSTPSINRNNDEGIWSAAYERFTIAADGMDAETQLEIPTTDSAELFILPDGKLFLRDRRNDNIVGFGHLTYQAGADTAMTYTGTMRFMLDDGNQVSEPVDIEATVSEEDLMSLTLSKDSETELTTIEAEYQYDQYGQKQQLDDWEGVYSTRLIHTSNDEQTITNMVIEDDGDMSAFNYRSDLMQGYRGKLDTPDNHKNLYHLTYETHELGADTPIQHRYHAYGYRSGDHLVLFENNGVAFRDNTDNVTAPETLLYRIRRLYKLPETTVNNQQQIRYQGIWNLTSNFGSDQRNAQMAVMPDGMVYFLQPCRIDRSAITYRGGTQDSKTDFILNFSSIEPIAQWCDANTQSLQLTNFKGTIDDENGITLTQSTNAANSQQWSGVRNSRLERNYAALSKISGIYTGSSGMIWDEDMQPITYTIDTDGKFINTFMYPAKSGNLWTQTTISAMLSPVSNHNLYIVNADTERFGKKTDGYAFSTDFWGNPMVFMNFFAIPSATTPLQDNLNQELIDTVYLLYR